MNNRSPIDFYATIIAQSPISSYGDYCQKSHYFFMQFNIQLSSQTT